MALRFAVFAVGSVRVAEVTSADKTDARGTSGPGVFEPARDTTRMADRGATCSEGPGQWHDFYIPLARGSKRTNSRRTARGIIIDRECLSRRSRRCGNGRIRRRWVVTTFRCYA